ncbi:hypothetical protein SAMN05216489_08192 [Streptomyces sp. 3213]|nr:hypothetical protein SAMN05216489_08192 [Streptomyces sp. 3213] [Streptomyces sp. 3213.3]
MSAGAWQSRVQACKATAGGQCSGSSSGLLMSISQRTSERPATACARCCRTPASRSHSIPRTNRLLPPTGSPPRTNAASGDQRSVISLPKCPRSAASRVSRASTRLALVRRPASPWGASAVAARASASLARPWLSLLRTVPTGTPQASAIRSYEVTPTLKCRSTSGSRSAGDSCSTASQIQSRIVWCSSHRSGPDSVAGTWWSSSGRWSGVPRSSERAVLRTIIRSQGPTASGSRTSPTRRSAVSAASCVTSSTSGPGPSTLTATARIPARCRSSSSPREATSPACAARVSAASSTRMISPVPRLLMLFLFRRSRRPYERNGRAF